MFISQNKKKGVFLIFALWLFLLLSLFCLGMAFRVFVLSRKTSLFINSFRARNLAVSGIKLAKEILKKDKGDSLGGVIDYLGEDWAKEKTEEALYTVPNKTGALTVSIEDESGRINLNNAANAANLKKLFEKQGIENKDEKVNNILDYIDGDNIMYGGTGSEPEGVFKNADMQTPEELLLVENFTKEDYNKLKDFIAVFTPFDPLSEKININTAKKEIVEALIDNEVLRDTVIKLRFGETEGSGDGCYGADDDIKKQLIDVGVKTAETITQQLKDLNFETTSSFFRITSTAEVGGVKKEIICVINRDSPEKILYWYEK